MARMRSLRPDYFLREDMADVSLEAHFLLAGLAVLADRDGRLLDRPRTIKAQVFPFREVDIESALAELVRAGVVARYSAHGRACIALLTWEDDQTPHPKETSAGIPPPSEASPGMVTEPSGKHGEPSRRDPLGLGVGIGSRDGSGSKMGPSSASQGASAPDAGEDLPDATDDAVDVPERPALELLPSPPDVPEAKPEKAPRKPSKAEVLYAGLEEDREEASTRAGLKFIPLGWPPARINKQLGPLAKVAADSEEAKELNAALEAFLDDPRGAAFNPPWDLGMFIVRLAEYKSRALRAAGGVS